MTEAKFTKGPLEVVPANENHGIYIADIEGRAVCDFYFLDSGRLGDVRQFDRAEENANLFAAAPDMYEALARIVEHTINPHVVEIAKPALKKARGELCP